MAVKISIDVYKRQEQIRNFDQLLQAALAHGRKGIAVAAPYDKNTLLAVKDALASGLAAPQLFGDVERMLPLLEQVQLDAGAVKLTDVRDTAQAIDAMCIRDRPRPRT